MELFYQKSWKAVVAMNWLHLKAVTFGCPSKLFQMNASKSVASLLCALTNVCSDRSWISSNLWALIFTCDHNGKSLDLFVLVDGAGLHLVLLCSGLPKFPVILFQAVSNYGYVWEEILGHRIWTPISQGHKRKEYEHQFLKAKVLHPQIYPACKSGLWESSG